MNITFEQRKARGFCTHCGERPALRGKTKCFDCALANARYLRNRRNAERAKRESHIGNLGLVHLSARDIKELRWQVFERSGSRCEIVWGATRCLNIFGWSNFALHHDPRGASKSDTMETTKAACFACHKKLHPGPQWSERIA